MTVRKVQQKHGGPAFIRGPLRLQTKAVVWLRGVSFPCLAEAVVVPGQVVPIEPVGVYVIEDLKSEEGGAARDTGCPLSNKLSSSRKMRSSNDWLSVLPKRGGRTGTDVEARHFAESLLDQVLQ